MADSVDSNAARLAAYVLVATWRDLGQAQEDYDLVWRAKEYLHDAADKLDARIGMPSNE